ncbi:MAG: hypothetical protein Q9197_002583 [Variospora fuerteventurae]
MASTEKNYAEILQELAALKASSAKRDEELAERKVELAEKTRLVQRTSLEELLEACYTDLDTSFQVETDPRKSTKGGITSPVGRLCPRTLQKWPDFPSLQSRTFGRAYQQLHPANSDPLRLFGSLNHIEELGMRLSERKIASENDLRRFHERAVEDFVVDILTNLSSPIRFDNHPHTLGQGPEQTPGRKQNRPPNADQLCVYQGEDGEGELLLVLEYKAPHKLTNDFLRAALKTSEPIDVIAIKDGLTIPPDDEPQLLFLHKARKMVAAAATQAYDYMLTGDCEYSAIVTGGAIVFLWISEDSPSTLHYHLAEPRLEVGKYAEEDFPDGFPHPRTAIAQLLSLCLMALKAKKRGVEWQRKAIQSAAKWVINDHEMDYETPKQLHDLLVKMDRQDLSFQGDDIRPDPRSPYELRKKKKNKQSAGQRCNADPQTNQDSSGSADDDSNDDSTYHETPTKPPAAKAPKAAPSHKPTPPQKQSEATSGSPKKGRRHAYCTQACLLGLVRRLPMDVNCPNVKLHPRKGKTHALTALKLRELLRNQLNRNMEDDCVDLRLQGARGMLFQLTLTSYGYTFVGKGTIDIYIPDLQHECRMYHRLQYLQGRLIPVCLGSIDLDIPWYDLNVEIIHILLMSYGGEAIEQARELQEKEQIQQFERTLAARGIKHQDIRRHNILDCKELGKLMFIDFERSTLDLDLVRRALQDVTPNRKRKWQQADKDGMLTSSPLSQKESSPVHVPRLLAHEEAY